MQGAMNVELSSVGDEELDMKIDEWLWWDKVKTHCVCQVAIHSFIHSFISLHSVDPCKVKLTLRI
jgi:hypothetical protein